MIASAGPACRFLLYVLSDRAIYSFSSLSEMTAIACDRYGDCLASLADEV